MKILIDKNFCFQQDISKYNISVDIFNINNSNIESVKKFIPSST